MTITDTQRTDVHNCLRDLMGQEMADIMMELLPPVGWGEVVRRQDVNGLGITLRAELSETRSDLQREIQAVRHELKTEISEVRNELKAEIQEVRTELRTEISEVRNELKTEIQEVRTELRTEISEVRSELKTEIQEVRTELKAEIREVRNELRAEIQEVRAELATFREVTNSRLDSLEKSINGLKQTMTALIGCNVAMFGVVLTLLWQSR